MTDIIVDVLLDGMFAAVAAIGFGAISDPGVRTFPFIALLAAVGHALRFSLINYAEVDIVTASLAASVSMGMLSLPLGRACHTPMTCLLIPALLPMVPGMYAYKSVFALILLIQNIDSNVQLLDYLEQFVANSAVTGMVIGVLAGGATIPVLIFKKQAFSMTRGRYKSVDK
ncbi:MAG: threonine/serine exporter family protein [Muribaculaceae bacterium]|jgi:hypothetical protein|nr:threonine/serine exporter family protein [Muribaculaceae bacterium]